MEGGKPENPGEKPQSRDENQQQTQPTWCRVRESNPGHSGGRRALSPLRHPCSSFCLLTTNLAEIFSFYWQFSFPFVVSLFDVCCKCPHRRKNCLAVYGSWMKMFKLACVIVREFVDGDCCTALVSPVTFWMVKGQWKETCHRKGTSRVYFSANPPGCQVHTHCSPFSNS